MLSGGGGGTTYQITVEAPQITVQVPADLSEMSRIRLARETEAATRRALAEALAPRTGP